MVSIMYNPTSIYIYYRRGVLYTIHITASIIFSNTPSPLTSTITYQIEHLIHLHNIIISTTCNFEYLIDLYIAQTNSWISPFSSQQLLYLFCLSLLRPRSTICLGFQERRTRREHRRKLPVHGPLLAISIY